MKKLIVLVLALIFVLGSIGYSSNKVDKTKPVFETENISRIAFYALSWDGNVFYDVPDEYMAEITTWLGTFTIDEKVKRNVPPGTNSIAVQIEYSDGTVVENGISTTEVNGVAYYMKHEGAPECYFEIFDTLVTQK